MKIIDGLCSEHLRIWGLRQSESKKKHRGKIANAVSRKCETPVAWDTLGRLRSGRNGGGYLRDGHEEAWAGKRGVRGGGGGVGFWDPLRESGHEGGNHHRMLGARGWPLSGVGSIASSDWESGSWSGRCLTFRSGCGHLSCDQKNNLVT